MKIKLLGKYEATVAYLFPNVFALREDVINVWLEFEESVGGCISFPVSIKAKDYTKEEFIEYVRGYAEAALTLIIQKDIEEREESWARDERRKDLNKLTADLGDKLGIEYRLADR